MPCHTSPNAPVPIRSVTCHRKSITTTLHCRFLIKTQERIQELFRLLDRLLGCVESMVSGISMCERDKTMKRVNVAWNSEREKMLSPTMDVSWIFNSTDSTCEGTRLSIAVPGPLQSSLLSRCRRLFTLPSPLRQRFATQRVQSDAAPRRWLDLICLKRRPVVLRVDLCRVVIQQY